MNTLKNNHLNEDHILTAMVDENDLPVMVREHLADCPQCRRAVDQFDEELSMLGHLAKEFSPTPEQPFSLPVEKERTAFRGAWKWKVSFGTAFSTLLILGVLWWSGMIMINPGPMKPEEVASSEMFEDEQLMTDISSLSENALPSLFMNISGEPDDETEDDFMEFVDPSDEEMSIS